MRLQITLATCVLLALILANSLRAAPLSDTQRLEDPTLNKRITLVSQRIYFGDLIEQLSQQSGTPLSVGTEDGAGDVEVAVSLHDTTLADALNGLWSLVSYRDADWDWTRTGTPGHYRYQLKRPAAARSLAQTWRQQIQDEFNAQTKKWLHGLEMTPEELREAAKTDPLLDSLVNNRDPRVRPEAEIVASLSPETRSRILNDGQGVQLQVSQLSPTAREFIHQQWIWARDHGNKIRTQSGDWIPVPEPQNIGIIATHFGHKFAPTLVVDDGFGGGDLIGGSWMEKEWRDKTTASWMLPGDAVDDPRSASLVRAPQKRAPNSPTIRPLALHITQMASSASLPVIARLPDERGTSSNIGSLSPYGMSVGAYLDQIRGLNLQRKWRDGVLLITDPTWFTRDEETAAPWATVAALRDAENGATDGFLPLDAILRAVRVLNRAQVAALAEQFPVMENVAHWYDLFALMTPPSDLTPYLMSPSGSTRADAIRAASAMLPIAGAIQDGTAWRIRLTQTRTAGEPTRRQFMFEVLDKSGRRIAGQGFSYTTHQFQSGAEGATGTVWK